jgi:DNA polymerase III subunit epsilon
MQTFVALDFETANRNRASACEIGLVRFVDGKQQDTYSTFLLPPAELRHFENEIRNKISFNDCHNAPSFENCFKDIIGFIGDDPVVCHYYPFDIDVLRKTLDYIGLSYPLFTYFCTHRLSKQILRGDSSIVSYSLKDVTSYFNIPFHELHRAEPDAIACGEIAVQLLRKSGVALMSDLSDQLNLFVGKMGSELDRGCRLKDKNIDLSTENLSAIAEVACKRLGVEGLDPSHDLFGKTVVLTGRLKFMTRPKATSLLKHVGANVKVAPSSNTDILIEGEQDNPNLSKDGISTKKRKCMNLKAKGCDIEVIDETNFLKMLES